MYMFTNYRASIALRFLICRKGCLGFGLPIVITASDRANACMLWLLLSSYGPVSTYRALAAILLVSKRSIKVLLHGPDP